MSKILFATDLDNTLIHSHRMKKDDDYCVERINGKEQSFMSKNTFHALANFNQKIDILPVTTRSIEQFNRIDFPYFCIKKAITTNGAFFIENGNISMIPVEPSLSYLDDLKLLENIIIQNYKVGSIKYSNNAFLYVVCPNHDIAKTIMIDLYNITKIKPIVSDRKVYFIPPYYKKENALKYIAKDKYDLIIAAGDSDLDIGMLNFADIAILPQSLNHKVYTKRKYICPDNIVFSDFIMIMIDDIIKNDESVS